MQPVVAPIRVWIWLTVTKHKASRPHDAQTLTPHKGFPAFRTFPQPLVLGFQRVTLGKQGFDAVSIQFGQALGVIGAVSVVLLFAAII
jgi:hypothetical protein